MMNKSIKMSMLFAGIVVSAIVLAVTISSYNGDNTENPNQAPQKANKPRPKDRPIIIWHYNSMRDSIESLRFALSSGLITHVSVGGILHRKDQDYKKNFNALEAIKIAKKSGVKLIWCRWLWPGYNFERRHAEDLFDPNYYIREIQALRAEAKAVGTDFVALDTEPYGKSPMRSYWKGERLLKAKDKDPPLILMDDHLPYPQAILQVFGQIKHCRRKNGRGRMKYPRLKAPADLQVGVVEKIRDSRGNLLKVSTKALFGKKKDIEKRIQKLGIGQKINTSHMERLNGTIRGQQERLAASDCFVR